MSERREPGPGERPERERVHPAPPRPPSEPPTSEELDVEGPNESAPGPNPPPEGEPKSP